jgi:hypothetical protein
MPHSNIGCTLRIFQGSILEKKWIPRRSTGDNPVAEREGIIIATTARA